MIKNKYENLVEQLTPQFTGNKSLFHWCSASGDAKFKSILSEHDSQALQCDCIKARKKSAGNHCPKGSGRLSTTSVTERSPFKNSKQSIYKQHPKTLQPSLGHECMKRTDQSNAGFWDAFQAKPVHIFFSLFLSDTFDLSWRCPPTCTFRWLPLLRAWKQHQNTKSASERSTTLLVIRIYLSLRQISVV